MWRMLYHAKSAYISLRRDIIQANKLSDASEHDPDQSQLKQIQQTTQKALADIDYILEFRAAYFELWVFFNLK